MFNRRHFLKRSALVSLTPALPTFLAKTALGNPENDDGSRRVQKLTRHAQQNLKPLGAVLRIERTDVFLFPAKTHGAFDSHPFNRLDTADYLHQGGFHGGRGLEDLSRILL